MWRIAAIALGVVTLGFSAAPSTSDSRRCTAHWQVLARPSAHLNAVAVLSPTDVWAVGWTGTWPDTRAVIAHWDGARLEVTPHPEVSRLFGVAGVSPTDVWAVGETDSAVIEHWDGVQWQRSSTPSGVSSLSDIVMQSSTSGWAVGASADGRPLAMRWDGSSWRRMVFLRSGKAGQFTALAATSAKDVWAMGFGGNSGSINFQGGIVVHWNGRAWRFVRAPTRDDSDLGYETFNSFDDAAAVSPSAAWAIHSGMVRSDIQRWNGRRWHIVRVFPPRDALFGVIAFQRQAWALGRRRGHPLLLHWNGKTWRVSGRRLTSLRGDLVAASSLSPRMIWAGGSKVFARYAC